MANPVQYSCLDISNPWGHKRVGCDWATKQQQQQRKNKSEFYLSQSEDYNPRSRLTESLENCSTC